MATFFSKYIQDFILEGILGPVVVDFWIFYEIMFAILGNPDDCFFFFRFMILNLSRILDQCWDRRVGSAVADGVPPSFF